jgi:hypothetical protein
VKEETHPALFKNVVAQFIGLLCRSAELTTKPDESDNYKNLEKGKILYEIMRRTIIVKEAVVA